VKAMHLDNDEGSFYLYDLSKSSVGDIFGMMQKYRKAPTRELFWFWELEKGILKGFKIPCQVQQPRGKGLTQFLFLLYNIDLYYIVRKIEIYIPPL